MMPCFGESLDNKTALKVDVMNLKREGKDLIDLHTDGGTPSPGELLESILHAIIGK
jgi:hypothetical protein